MCLAGWNLRKKLGKTCFSIVEEGMAKGLELILRRDLLFNFILEGLLLLYLGYNGLWIEWLLAMPVEGKLVS